MKWSYLQFSRPLKFYPAKNEFDVVQYKQGKQLKAAMKKDKGQWIRIDNTTGKQIKKSNMIGFETQSLGISILFPSFLFVLICFAYICILSFFHRKNCDFAYSVSNRFFFLQICCVPFVNLQIIC